ncbi:hypothetical protein HL653_17020 [Sphingomonas sp. AP4-R1]|uniref:alpha/beta hydrolase n=1 Tax=Sphingomonas sp. AP4-R1 TaxID=2735134 RepID=UPI0014932E09|nr:acetylxylan esterase [Sphingomonas sp. AP4-R1]QJU59239.1 hypothetical protein HL653_17020 [Sphingomonas sp. AP4-R1]
MRTIAGTALAAFLALPTEAQPAARDRLITYLTALAQERTTERAATMAAITSPEQARARQTDVRTTLAELIRPEPVGGPVRARITHSERRDGYTVQAVWYESLPGYRVTADLYRPNGNGPFPAILIQPGHGLDGKVGDHDLAVNLARAGFMVLSIDIVGEGERIQFYDPAIGASKVGRPTGEHSMAFAQALPTGGHVSRFFLADAMRGIDYLSARRDVDKGRIGAFGCSGGGTATAYVAALDPRIQAAAIACYVNDMTHLLARGGPGVQDAEQSIPFFLERGLDLPDWIEAIAPRPLAIVSTTEDMFPIAGARAAFAEARHFYAAMDAADHIAMIEGPGRHGALRPVSARIVAFFTRWLKNDPAERAFVEEPIGDPTTLLVYPAVTPGTAAGGRPLAELIAAEAPRPVAIAGETETVRLTRLRSAIRDVARTTVTAAAPPPEMVLGEATQREGYTLAAIHFDAGRGLRVDGWYARTDRAGPRPTVLLLSAAPLATIAAAGGGIDVWARAGWNVLAIEARGTGGSEEQKSPLTGDWTLLSLRALLVGKTPVGMRADDALAALNWLATRPEVDRTALSVQGTGALGPVALHVGVLDDRVARVIAERSQVRYRDIAEHPISRDAAEINLPGVLARYDLPDLMAVLGNRLTLVNPINVVGEPLKSGDWRAIVPADVHVILRADRDPSPPPASSPVR